MRTAEFGAQPRDGQVQINRRDIATGKMRFDIITPAEAFVLARQLLASIPEGAIHDQR